MAPMPITETTASVVVSRRSWLQSLRARLPARLHSPLQANVHQVVLATAVFLALSANGPFFSAALSGRAWADASTWGFAIALAAALLALQLLLLLLLCNRWTVKPVLGLLLVGSAVAAFTMSIYGIYLDPAMLRNLLHTHPAEARELLSAPLLVHLTLYAGLPLLLLWRVQVRPLPWRRALVWRLALLVGAALALVAAVLLVFQPLASLMRNHKELRYLITPANVLWSTGAVLAADARGATAPRQPIGLDATAGPSWATRSRPLVLVLVVGETARAADWGLSTAWRQTTPELARLPVINFAETQACGTSTEVSLPCMFAPVGRRDYDETRIRGQQSLLHVAARAGVAVHWRDNQSGCKGVCDGLPTERVTVFDGAGCGDGSCPDEALVADLDQRLQAARGTQLWVLHMIGSHGPAYHRRYPPAFGRFQPACREDDLQRCSAEQIRNAYDNSVLYTDHVLASAIARLQAHAGTVDSAMVYLSDHGESLGERGLYLHGMPYAIAPEVQTRVPMTMWFSDGLEAAAGLRPGCLRPILAQRARSTVSHDHLFHTVLGLLDVRSAVRDEAWNLVGDCVAVAAR